MADITCAYRDSLEQAFRHFIAQGIDSIGFIGDSHTQLKLGWFREVSAKLGLAISEQSIAISDTRFEAGGYQAMQQLLKSENFPKGILCAYDYMAIGAIRCLHDHGLRVPEDVAIIGMDNIAQAPYLTPALSSIQFPTSQCCRTAADAMIAFLTGKTWDAPTILPCQLHLRESSRLG